MKICALLVPREMKLEHSGGVKAMTDEQIERGIELIKEMLAQREAGANAKVIEGTAQGTALPVPTTLSNPGASDPIDCLTMWTRRWVRFASLVSLAKLAQHVWVDGGMLAAFSMLAHRKMLYARARKCPVLLCSQNGFRPLWRRSGPPVRKRAPSPLRTKSARLASGQRWTQRTPEGGDDNDAAQPQARSTANRLRSASAQ
jgi:hypothetical protein